MLLNLVDSFKKLRFQITREMYLFDEKPLANGTHALVQAIKKIACEMVSLLKLETRMKLRRHATLCSNQFADVMRFTDCKN